MRQAFGEFSSATRITTTILSRNTPFQLSLTAILAVSSAKEAGPSSESSVRLKRAFAAYHHHHHFPYFAAPVIPIPSGYLHPLPTTHYHPDFFVHDPLHTAAATDTSSTATTTNIVGRGDVSDSVPPLTSSSNPSPPNYSSFYDHFDPARGVASSPYPATLALPYPNHYHQVVHHHHDNHHDHPHLFHEETPQFIIDEHFTAPELLERPHPHPHLDLHRKRR